MSRSEALSIGVSCMQIRQSRQQILKLASLHQYHPSQSASIKAALLPYCCQIETAKTTFLGNIHSPLVIRISAHRLRSPSSLSTLNLRRQVDRNLAMANPAYHLQALPETDLYPSDCTTSYPPCIAGSFPIDGGRSDPGAGPIACSQTLLHK